MILNGQWFRIVPEGMSYTKYFSTLNIERLSVSCCHCKLYGHNLFCPLALALELLLSIPLGSFFCMEKNEDNMV